MWNDALPRNGITNWSVFYAQQNTTTTNGWLSWMKPAGVSWVYFFVISAGGSGGGGNPATPCAGAGGGSGSVTRLLIPATFLPDIIYLRPGTASVTTYISIAPNTTAQNLILSAASGGAATGNGNVAGIGATAASSSSGIWMNIGLFTSIAGQNGADSQTIGTDTPGNSVTFGASGLCTTGGATGGRGSGAGGNIIGAGLLPTISGGAGTTGDVGNVGFRLGQTLAPGFKLFPLLFSGGAGGGGGGATGNGGVGGRASFGGGGGGGGMNNSTNVGPFINGGLGGPALILIGAF
jgi:hypothetical protein